MPGRAPQRRPQSEERQRLLAAGRGGPVGGGGSRRARCWWWRCWSAFFGVAGGLVLYLNSAELKWAGEAGVPRGACLPGSSLPAGAGGALAGRRPLGRYRAIVLSLLLYPSRLWPAGLQPSPAAESSFCGEIPSARLEPACPSPGCQYTSRHLLRPHPHERCCSPWPPAPSGTASPLPGPTR